MENLKINAKTPEESKEVQKLFFKLGMSWLSGSKEFLELNTPYLYTTGDRFYCGDYHSTFNEDGRKRVTLSELKRLVASKSISKPFKEYLVFNGDGVFYATNQDKGMVGTCYEIPAGAQFSTGVDKPVFRKDEFYWDDGRSLAGDEPCWVGSKITLANAKSRGFNIPWIRGSQREQSLNDIAKTAEDHRQSLMVRPEDAPIELTSFGYFPDPEPDLSTALNGLCNEFGCPPGAHRMSWLRQQLVTAKRATDSLSGAKEPVTIDRETARHRLAMMFRGNRTTINGREVDFDEFGYFDVHYDFNGGFRSQSLKATLDYLFK